MLLSPVRIAPFTLVLSILLASSFAFGQDAAPTGVRWEVTSQPTLSMNGMNMPMAARTTKVCAPVNPAEPPGSSNDEQGCVGSNFVRDNLKVSWTSLCTGPPAMTGLGELHYATEDMDAYTGVITYSVDNGTMIINLAGKVIDSCDNPKSR